MHLFMSGLALFILSSTHSGELSNPFGIVSLVGILFAALGWYFSRLKPNYFIGIRTPWTLESEEVWYQTHKTSGPVWMIGGLIMAIVPLIAKDLAIYAVLGITLLLAGFLPGIFSAIVYAVIIIIWAKINPNLAPAGRKYSFNEKIKALPGIIPIAMVF